MQFEDFAQAKTYDPATLGTDLGDRLRALLTIEVWAGS
jgi:hypothetical protein